MEVFIILVKRYNLMGELVDVYIDDAFENKADAKYYIKNYLEPEGSPCDVYEIVPKFVGGTA